MLVLYFFYQKPGDDEDDASRFSTAFKMLSQSEGAPWERLLARALELESERPILAWDERALDALLARMQVPGDGGASLEACLAASNRAGRVVMKQLVVDEPVPEALREVIHVLEQSSEAVSLDGERSSENGEGQASHGTRGSAAVPAQPPAAQPFAAQPLAAQPPAAPRVEFGHNTISVVVASHRFR